MRERWVRGVMTTVLGVLLALSGCSTEPTTAALPAADPGRGAIGIQVSIEPMLGSAYVAQYAYFARVDEQRQRVDNLVYVTTLNRGGRLYLLNVPPGRYQAIAAMFQVGLFGPGDAYVTYFPRDLADATGIEAVAGRLAFAGRVTAKMASIGVCPGEADDLQLRTAETLFPGPPKCGIGRMLLHEIATNSMVIGGQVYTAGSTVYHYRGAAGPVARQPADEDGFRTQATADLAGSGWAAAR